ncbi:hypothetical protein LINGRAHAP2_LOCUS33846 [Linum grandiflorum]
MEKTSAKLIFFAVLLIFVAGQTSNIGVEGRLNQIVPCLPCSLPCHCLFEDCYCGGDLPMTSRPKQNPMVLSMDPPMPSQ